MGTLPIRDGITKCPSHSRPLRQTAKSSSSPTKKAASWKWSKPGAGKSCAPFQQPRATGSPPPICTRIGNKSRIDLGVAPCRFCRARRMINRSYDRLQTANHIDLRGSPPQFIRPSGLIFLQGENHPTTHYQGHRRLSRSTGISGCPLGRSPDRILYRKSPPVRTALQRMPGKRLSRLDGWGPAY